MCSTLYTGFIIILILDIEFIVTVCLPTIDLSHLKDEIEATIIFVK